MLFLINCHDTETKERYMQTQNPSSMLKVFFLFFHFLSFVSVDAGAPIPARLDGFWYGSSRISMAESIIIEAFVDPVCPDSKDAWAPLKQVLNHYGSRVSLLVHTFPLPYHDNAFPCSRALHIIDKLNSSATFSLLESFFANQAQFWNEATFNASKASVIDKILRFAAKSVGKSYEAGMKSGFSDSATDQATRISFKYGCSRGVYGTPFFFVNGFALSDAGSAIDYNKWRRIIDPLIREQDMERQGNLHFFL